MPIYTPEQHGQSWLVRVADSMTPPRFADRFVEVTDEQEARLVASAWPMLTLLTFVAGYDLDNRTDPRLQYVIQSARALVGDAGRKPWPADAGYQHKTT